MATFELTHKFLEAIKNDVTINYRVTAFKLMEDL